MKISSEKRKFVLIVLATLFILVVPPSVLAGESPVIEEDDPVLGPADAPVTIVAFLDLECPNSKKLYPSLRKAVEKFPGQLRVVVKHFPLPIHNNAPVMAEHAQCLVSGGKFFEFADMVYGEHYRCLECVDDMLSKLGVAADEHAACMGKAGNAAAVARDMSYGKSLGVSATPTMFINGEMIEGAISYRQLTWQIRALLK